MIRLSHFSKWTFFLLASFLFACSSEENEVFDEIEIRISNETPFILEDFQLNAFSKEGFYGSLFPAEQSEYANYPYAYSFIGLNFNINGIEFNYQPSGFETDDRLAFGQYEVVIKEVDTTHLTFRFQFGPKD
jgi:hypothetical protein